MALVDLCVSPEALNRLQSPEIGLQVAGLRNRIRISDRSSFEAPILCHARLDEGTQINIGAYCSIAVARMGNVKIGRYTSIADEVRIGANEHPVDWLSISRIPYVPHMHNWHKLLPESRQRYIEGSPYRFQNACRVTEIGNDVLIGYRAYIKPGVKIGSGAVIGAGSIVTTDIPPYAIAVGCPAKVVKHRFPHHIIEQLLALRWWNYNLYDLFDLIPLDKPEEAIPILQELIDRGEIQPWKGRVFTPESLISS